VLVTGGRGFIGRHTVAALERVGVDAVSAGRPDVEIPSPAFDRLLRVRPPAVVVHCAGPASVAASLARPQRDHEGSVGTTGHLVAALRGLASPPRVVLVSSAAVYGSPARLPVSETDPAEPISPYGRHRLEAEDVVRMSGLPFVVARVFSAYGEGLRRQVLWDVATKALAGAVELWGTGEETRDFVHVEDVAAALVRLSLDDALDGRVANVASGTETRIADLARLLVEALGVTAPVSFNGVERPGDPLRWRADVDTIRSVGWERRIDLASGVARYARWVKEHAR
jgi:UDP-glucose 4-epimerase